MPFHMDDTEERYRDGETKIFYLSQVQKELIPESAIKEYFLGTFGWHVNLYLSYGQSFEYFMTFQKQEEAREFSEKMEDGQLLGKGVGVWEA